MDYADILEEKEKINELTKIMVDSLAAPGELSDVAQTHAHQSVNQGLPKWDYTQTYQQAASKDDPNRREDESSKGLTLHDEYMQNSPLMIENMERKSKLIQGDSADADTAVKGKETASAAPALNTLKNSKQPTGDLSQPQ